MSIARCFLAAGAKRPDDAMLCTTDPSKVLGWLESSVGEGAVWTAGFDAADASGAVVVAVWDAPVALELGAMLGVGCVAPD